MIVAIVVLGISAVEGFWRACQLFGNHEDKAGLFSLGYSFACLTAIGQLLYERFGQ